MKQHTNLNKSLQELEHSDWGEPTFNSSLVVECHRLRRVPLRQLRVEDLRLLIGQEVGLPYLVPLAFEVLHTDPLAEGDYYPGDLLSSVFKIPTNFWKQNPQLKQDRKEIWAKAIKEIEALGENAGSIVLDLRKTLELDFAENTK